MSTSDAAADPRPERLGTPGGVVSGALSLVALAGLAGFVVWDPRLNPPAWFFGLVVVAAALVWVVLVRPAVLLTRDDLVLRNPLVTVRIPLVAVEDVSVRQVLVVRAGARGWTTAALGRSRRQVRAADWAGRADRAAASPVLDVHGMVEDRVRSRVRDARRRSRTPDPLSEEAAAWPDALPPGTSIREERAWSSVAVLALALVLLAATIAVG